MIEGIPTVRGAARSFRVTPVEIFAPDAKFVAFNGTTERTIARPDVSVFEGEEVGNPDHRIVLTISGKRDVRALLFEGKKVTTVIHPLSTAAGRHAVVDPETSQAPDHPFCDGAIPDPTAASIFSESSAASLDPNAAASIVGPVLAGEGIFDIGYTLYQKLGSNTSTASTYAANVVGASSAIYRRDVSIVLLIKQITVWTAADPFGTVSTDAQLTAYRSWNKSNRSGVARDFAHLLSKSSGLGGLAYLNALCSTDIGYGVSNLDGYNTSFPTTGYQWDINVVSHEIGHNFGASHTHCYSPALDRCWSGESGCYSGPVEVSVGEVMSYCHLYGLVEMQFRSFIAGRIRSGATSHACIGSAPGTCGNGVVDGGEQCDDGNLAAGDGCEPNCITDVCWTCSGSPSACAPKADGVSCGDANRCTVTDKCRSGVCTPARYGCTVVSEQKISQLSGNFGGTLANSDFFGTAVAGLGDLDGDGVPDIAVGTIGDDQAGSASGAVWILFLQSDGTVKTQVKITRNIAGFTGSLVAGDHFGDGVAAIGDLDDDGIIDLAVGASQIDDGGTNRGGLFILFLNADGTVRANQRISSTAGGFTGTLAASDFFGASVAGLDDVDGDGVEDLAVGAPGDDDGGLGAGAAYVLLMNTNGTVKGSRSIVAPIAGIGLGTSVAGLGDLDGDGTPDMAAGAPLLDDGGTNVGGVLVLFLQPDGSTTASQWISALQGGSVGPLFAGDSFGRTVAGLPDIDGNGTAELAVGVPGDDDGGTDRGAMDQIVLDTDGQALARVKISSLFDGLPVDSLRDSDSFGTGIAVVGDLDGKGQFELVVGAPGDDDGGSARGAVYVLFRDGCGGGRVSAGEECDDGNESESDGCSSSCQIEDGWTCTGTTSYCTPIHGDGRIVGSEECDDGNLQNGDGCSSTGVVEPGFDCTGEPSTCTYTCGDGIVNTFEDCDIGIPGASDCCSATCDFKVSGMACSTNDGNECTDDICDGAGTCVRPFNTASCEDGNPCTPSDRCSGGTCESDLSPRLAEGCRSALKQQFQLKWNADGARTSLKWKWSAGQGIEHASLGAPVADTGYSLCVYDSTEGASSLRMSVQVPAGPAWSDLNPHGFSYVDKAASAHGVQKIRLKPGAAGKTSAQVKAGKDALPIVAPIGSTTYFAQDPHVIVQLVGTNGLCLTSEFTSTGTSANDGKKFKAKTP